MYAKRMKICVISIAFMQISEALPIVCVVRRSLLDDGKNNYVVVSYRYDRQKAQVFIC